VVSRLSKFARNDAEQQAPTANKGFEVRCRTPREWPLVLRSAYFRPSAPALVWMEFGFSTDITPRQPGAPAKWGRGPLSELDAKPGMRLDHLWGNCRGIVGRNSAIANPLAGATLAPADAAMGIFSLRKVSNWGCRRADPRLTPRGACVSLYWRITYNAWQTATTLINLLPMCLTVVPCLTCRSTNDAIERGCDIWW